MPVRRLCRIFYGEKLWHMWRRMVISCKVGLNFHLFLPFYVAKTNTRNYLISANGHITLSGSNVMQSIAIEAIKTIPGDSNWTYFEHKGSDSRLFLDIPQVSFSFVSIQIALYKIITLFPNIMQKAILNLWFDKIFVLYFIGICFCVYLHLNQNALSSETLTCVLQISITFTERG